LQNLKRKRESIVVWELEGKNYIVTGASSGIGRAVCVELSKQKSNVILVARNEERLQETLEKMIPANHRAISFDLTNIEDINKIVADIYEKCNTIDGIIYCAGYGTATTLRKTTYEVLHRDMLINYYAFVELVRCVVKDKPKKHPMRIVSISSIASILNTINYTAYSASKAALDAAVRVLSTELIKKNTTINTIRPAYVDTEALTFTNDLFEDFTEHIKKTGFQPLGLIDPYDVAKMTVYLMSDAAKSITGMNIPINGGARF